MFSDGKRIGIFGRSGSGKSAGAKALAKKIDRLVVFDIEGEYSSKKKRGLDGCVEFSKIEDVLKFIKKNALGKFRVAYIPPAGAEEEALHRLSVMILNVQKKLSDSRQFLPINLLVEEMAECYPNNKISPAKNGFGTLCSRGRKWGVSVIGVSQRVAEVNTKFRGNCDTMRFYALSDFVDVQTACTKIGKAYKDKILELENHKYIEWEAGKITEKRNIL